MKILPLFIIAAALSSCTLTVSTDGSRQWRLSGRELGETIQALSSIPAEK